MIIMSIKEHTREIWYISDLHFDYAKNLTIYRARLNNFFNLVTSHPNVIFVLAGDFFDSYQETAAFINRLETNHVTCLLVLGNHDYWSNGQFTYAEILEKMEKATAMNRFAHLLTTGRIVKIDNQVFIGDSGFTNFFYQEKPTRDSRTGEIIVPPTKTASLDDFGSRFVELNQVRNWNIKNIQVLHERWITFANKQISTTKNLIVVTHWPMFADAPTSAQDTWWQVKTSLLKTNKFWSIYGHIHRNGLKAHDASVQIGYQSTKDFSSLRFGQLIPLSSSRSLTTVGERVRQHQTFQLEESEHPLMTPTRVSRSGYRRAAHADSKKLLTAFLDDRDQLFDDLKKKAGSKTRPLNGLLDVDAAIMNNMHDDVLDALKVLKAGYRGNVFDFYTALIIAGYAYSDKLRYMPEMRPVDIYDVTREYMELFTLQYFEKEIDIHKKFATRASARKESHLMVGNIPIKFPRINGHEVPPASLEGFQEKINQLMDAPKDRQPSLQIEGPQAPRMTAQVHNDAADFIARYNQDRQPNIVAFNQKGMHIITDRGEIEGSQKISQKNLQQLWTKHPITQLKVGMLIHHRSMGIGKITKIIDSEKGQYLADFSSKKNVELFTANGLVSDQIPKEYEKRIE